MTGLLADPLYLVACLAVLVGVASMLAAIVVALGPRPTRHEAPAPEGPDND